ncbi:MAG: hypothetical protein JNJ40_12590 [Bacteroidia bacterium]|nr:hypothetical protein [Bacteroidia bacterium]
MGLFSIDIEKYYNEQAQAGKSLLGLFVIQYPLYCIHANIQDSTPDSLDSLDRVITDFIRVKEDISPFQMSSLLGTSVTLVKQRILSLLSDELLEKTTKGLKLSYDGEIIFKEKKQLRQHKRSYDFYIDGVTLKPLPMTFYSHYKSKFISEYDSYTRTWRDGRETIERPFGPDLVHSPPDKTIIIGNLFKIPKEERVDYKIPALLQEIEDLTYTKMTFFLMVAALRGNETVYKELIDPYTIYTISNDLTYTESLKKNAELFLPSIENRIKNLEFKLFTRPRKEKDDQDPIPTLTTNWAEIDKYKDSENGCFNFAKDDIIKAMKGLYGMKTLDSDSIQNTRTNLEINITKDILLNSSNKGKLINDLMRKRDYRFGNTDNNVFLMFVHYKTNDPYVIELIRFKELILIARNDEEININWVQEKIKDFSVSFRELCISSGELQLLEKLDIQSFMSKY